MWYVADPAVDVADVGVTVGDIQGQFVIVAGPLGCSIRDGAVGLSFSLRGPDHDEQGDEANAAYSQRGLHGPPSI